MSQAYREPARHLPIACEVAVLVVGGGTTGVVAAIAAARNGARTLLIEQNGFLGGSQTGSQVTPMMANHVDGKPLNRGIGEEIMLRLQEAGFALGAESQAWFDPEMLKGIMDDMVVEAGVEVLFHTFLAGAIVEDGVLRGVIVENKGGRQVIMARRVVDCSGDADVAKLAGVPMREGNEADGVHQAVSLRFVMGGIDLERFASFLRELGEQPSLPLLHTAMVWNRGLKLEPIFRRAVEDGVLDVTDGNYFQVFGVPGRPGELAFNCPEIPYRHDGTDPRDLTWAQQEGRRRQRRFLRFCRQYLPGFEGAFISSSAAMVGIRETRRIEGEYTLTEADYQECRKFPDAIARNRYPLDVHGPRKSINEEKRNLIYLPAGEYHEIPYRCLVPLKVENLLVAGRCISATFIAQSSVRVQSNCQAFGQAAGTAAAISLREGISPRGLDGLRLRALLREQGANL